jgi:HEAT repeat protein
MPLLRSNAFIFGAALLAALAGCATQNEMTIDRSQLISALEHEMVSNTQWLRIHAAEGLLDNGESAKKIAGLFRSEINTAAAPYRIGVWRVMARSTTGAERGEYVERIRAAMHDPQAIDRISAAESLGKLNAASRADRNLITDWIATADDATAAFPRWLMVLSSTPSERATDEAGLAALLNSKDPVARLRAAFALGRLKEISDDSIKRLHEQLEVEPADSIARVYLITALLLRAKDASTLAACERKLIPYLHGKANEQLEVGIVTGLRGKPEGLARLQPLLNDPEADARIGAANGLLRLLK